MTNKRLLLSTIFITGFCALVIEVIGVRALSPFFGNTMFTVSSVISVFLAALSFGYYIGGVAADKKASLALFYFIILLSGISVLGIQILYFAVLPLIAFSLSIVTGPLLVALLLFFSPGLLLGMLSPFVVKLRLQEESTDNSGKVTGEIFFWSTFGSIFGSLATGFILVPTLGINTIIIGTGVILSLLGLLPLVYLKVRNRLLLYVVILLVLEIVILFLLYPKKALAIHEEDGLYEKIVISEGERKGQETRFLFQDRNLSAGAFTESDEIVFDYIKYYELYKLVNPDINNALILGGGGYTVPKELLKKNQTVQIDVNEIEPSLYNLSKKYLHLRDSPRLHNHIVDGRRFLTTTEKKYDYMFSDVYNTHYTIPHHFTTIEYFQLAKNKLNPNGVFIANFVGSLADTTPSLLLSEMNTFRQVFTNSYFFGVSSPNTTTPQNIIFFGVNNDTKVNLAQFTTHQIDVKRHDLKKHTVFTDNYAPVEFYSSELFAK